MNKIMKLLILAPLLVFSSFETINSDFSIHARIKERLDSELGQTNCLLRVIEHGIESSEFTNCQLSFPVDLNANIQDSYRIYDDVFENNENVQPMIDWSDVQIDFSIEPLLQLPSPVKSKSPKSKKRKQDKRIIPSRIFKDASNESGHSTEDEVLLIDDAILSKNRKIQN